VQKLPLEGIRVIDFTAALAGPHLTQWLAVMGAEVIKIETKLRSATSLTVTDLLTLDTVRQCSKKRITLNMTKPEAAPLVKELVKISDVIAENFGGPVMDRWGLGYQELKKLKSDIIFYAGSGYGRTGLRTKSPANAFIIGAFVGLTYVNGYVGGEPVTMGGGGWTDYMQALHGTFAILAALYHRSKTGEGQYIDAAMAEGSANLLGELVMDYTMNERVGERIGNRDNIMAPHGCYRCQGEDKWVAIAISSEEEWEAFCSTIGNPKWTKREEFSDELSRWKNQNELDKLIEEWTKRHHHYEVMEILQKAGIMAGASINVEELGGDPHLKKREFLVDIEQPEVGKLRFPSLPWRLNDTPRGNYYYSALMGEHNDYVFGGLLGMPKEEIRRLEEEKVIY
jgi:benzylsuccinate CoA-transferase BbsF subunit